jgi:uncharacterized protein YciI
MSLFAITCADKPGHAHVRAANREAHLEYARPFKDKMAIGGPLLTPDGQGMVGSLLIMEFDDIDAAYAWTREDPYAKAGLFESVVVRPYKKVFP